MKQAEADAINYTQIFEDREIGLIDDSINYAKGNPSGLPGHNLCIIIFKLVNIILTLRGENAVS